MLDRDKPIIEGVVAPQTQIDASATGPFMPELARDNAPLEKVIYDGAMMRFYDFFLGGPARHFDYTWFRAKQPGTNTATTPHCDIVYMGRGTKELYTSWTPFGDVPYEMGGLMVLEDSHKNGELKGGYGQTDVDMFCENDSSEARDIVETARMEQRELTGEELGKIRWNSSGAYSNDAIAVREDTNLEPAFWGQFPGNEGYLVRRALISSANMASFGSLHGFALGQAQGNHWGEAVTLLCHVQNHGDTVLNISAIMGSLNNVQDFGFHIQVIVQYTDHQSYPCTALPLP
jgi:hypothetical protein